MDTTPTAVGSTSGSLRLRAVEIAGPAGLLEGLLNAPDSDTDAAPLCALVCTERAGLRACCV